MCALFGFIFGILVAKGFLTDHDAEEISQISEWRSLVCLSLYSYSFTCGIPTCLVKGRFGNKRNALSFRRLFDGPKHSLHAIKLLFIVFVLSIGDHRVS